MSLDGKEKRNKRNNLIVRLKTIYKEIGKQIKHVSENEGSNRERKNLFALADKIIYLFSHKIIGNIFRVSPLCYLFERNSLGYFFRNCWRTHYDIVKFTNKIKWPINWFYWVFSEVEIGKSDFVYSWKYFDDLSERNSMKM